MGNSLFTSIPVQKPQRNFFDLSHNVLQTLDMGWLVPTMWLECYPGDTIKVGCSVLLKLAPLIAPVMGANINWYVHTFFVPYRVLWVNWEKYLKSPTNPDPDGDPDPVFPFFRYAGEFVGESNLFDYLGCPPIGVNEVTNSVDLQAMPIAAYHKICVDYYLDENQYDLDSVIWTLVDGDNTTRFGPGLYRRAWRKDYFTSALPWPQKGPIVNIPIGTLEDVRVFRNAASPGTTMLTGTPDSQVVAYRPSTNTDVGADNLYANTEGLQLDAASINNLRTAVELQKFLERMARGGTRGTEIIRSVWGVTPPDYRLQRAEYITGARGPVVISEVLNTAGTFDPGTDTPTSPPQGNMSGHGMSVGSNYPGKYFCTEHGVLMSIMSIIPEANYKDGINATFLAKDSAIDGLAWPQFGNLGEQPIKNVEVYADLNTPELQEGTFGYTPRYAQYKYMPNRVSGAFRSSLAYWTMFRDFTSDGTVAVPLNNTFIDCAPSKDIFAVTAGEVNSFYCLIHHDLKTKRCFPKFGVPSNL